MGVMHYADYNTRTTKHGKQSLPLNTGMGIIQNIYEWYNSNKSQTAL